MPVVHVNSQAEWDSYMSAGKSAFSGGKAVMVDFFAEWCGPCKVVAPFYEQLSDQYKSVVFLKVDVDALSEVASTCGVRAMPTFMGFFGGQKVGEVVGVNQSGLRALAEELTGKASASQGTAHKLGGAEGSTAAAAAPPDDSAEARRARALAAAEARMKCN